MAATCRICHVPEHERCRSCGEPVWFSPIWLRRFDAHGSGPHWCAGDRAEVAALGPLRTGIECVCGAHVERDDADAKWEYGGEPHVCAFQKAQQVQVPAARPPEDAPLPATKAEPPLRRGRRVVQ